MEEDIVRRPLEVRWHKRLFHEVKKKEEKIAEELGGISPITMMIAIARM